MRKSDRQKQYSPTTPQAPQQSHTALDEAEAMFERMKGEVLRQSERGEKEAVARGPFVRFLLALTLAACLLAAGTMLYGIYNFPDAPIRRTDSGYVGKGGKPHTRDDFEAFVLWRKALLAVIPSVFVIGFTTVIADSMRRRRYARSEPHVR